ncbi:MAG: cyclic nucleotide-binding domain-containing protein, partial [Deltaproteobacteria bacterium]|nr:cyclic nucleotide-binding domain-containing protein [Deltaproteobacteria bacterium]
EVEEVEEVSIVAAGESLDTIDLSLVIEALPPERRAEIEGLRPPPQTREGVFELNLDDLEVIDEAFEAIEVPSSADRILDIMPPTPLFSFLERDALRMLIEQVDVRFFGPGERIIRSGSGGTSLFVLVEGEVVVWREGPSRVEIGRLNEGSFFGEIALLTQRARSATVEAVGECTILEISRIVVGKLVLKHPAMLRVLLRFFRERLVDSLVDTHDLFAPFAGPDREDLARRFSFIEVRHGTVLAREGEPADGLYIVLAGAVRAHREGGATTVLGPGDLFGETSLLTEEHSVATVTSDEKCWLLRMDCGVFRETIMTHPHVLAVLADVSTQRAAARKNALAGGGLDEARIPIL